MRMGAHCVVGKRVQIGARVVLGHGVIVEDGAVLGDDVWIDSHAIVRGNARIGAGGHIGAHCIIAEYQMDFCRDHVFREHPLVIGAHALIRSGTILYAGSQIGSYFMTGHNVMVREDVTIGDHVSIGNYSDVQNEVQIGSYVRLHSNDRIEQLSRIDDYVWLAPGVELTNDPTPPSDDMAGVHVHSFAVIGAQATVLPGCEIQAGSLVAAGSVVTRDVAKETVVAGNPARSMGSVRTVHRRGAHAEEAAYPWRERFSRAMPWDGVGYSAWAREQAPAAHKERRKIRVAFLMQNPYCWDKQRPVCETLCADEAFEVLGIVVPGYECYDIGVRPFGAWGAEHEYFHNLYNGLIDAVGGDGKLIDLRDYAPDYVFYQRPYNIVFPPALKSGYVGQFAKVCYLPYCTNDVKPFERSITSLHDFFDPAYLYFAEGRSMHAAFFQEYGARIAAGTFRNVLTGYPVLERAYMERANYVPGEKLRVLWTPRWRYANPIGGSHFPQYKDKIIAWKQAHEAEMELTVRPHPLLWQNMINEGFMTRETTEAYKEKLRQAGIALDANALVEDTFRTTDVLLTDSSSIVDVFFLSARPIIYCPYTDDLNEEYRQMFTAMYIARSWEEVERYLALLLSGEDPLRKHREALVAEFSKLHIGATQRVVETLREDGMKQIEKEGNRVRD